MINNLKYLITITLFISIISCKSDKKLTYAYFGGKIIHPKSNHVILYSMDQVIDTFYLDNDDKFIGKVTLPVEGLFYFSHGYENQHVYLEPGDSVLLRLNTWNFDESLVFVGKGAERNNILIDCFLEDEKESFSFHEFNKLDSKEFQRKIASSLKSNIELYNEYAESHPQETDGFKKVLKVALTYPLYARMEKYPILNAKYAKSEQLPKINNSFYDYRKFAKIDNDSLIYYPPYSQYVRNYLYNETYSLGHPPMKKNYSPKFTSDLMTIIDKKISFENTKNAFLKQTVISHFYNKSSCELNEETFEKYFKLSTNEEDKILVRKLLNDTKAVVASNQLQDFNINDYSNATLSIFDVIKQKNALLFFWSPEYVSESYIFSRMNFLSINYTNIIFIPVKIDGKKSERVESLDIKSQYYLPDDSKANDFLTCKMPRCILVDKKGKVMNGFASISSSNLSDYLEILNKVN
ncbi:MAG: hypothetical protein GW772_03925 [Flavobacteriia bacterium]|nr:hypothetical protein [Flavobacteriia bacterium]OIP48775.1 MAG: hypothetical protein AUK46_00435 [Flavobacteriaceae bacterium CG2_30_31_66]PIV95494.1 MAG: hypothetical protein COW43_13260 [Flavobacteriaceae bacterium CG17_big_fil_post_rev_8_21_14_2_50_31_13]PIX13888.1 MAG: hypothetical protein COZ74_04455 [Flavobacteriaceae bacterium CG_4_8_14_3_um_filter_31_8]PIY14203.1 MAG: hypothetical protein COZ16_10420 [Flavobacteriaceae bacterium CG_4_10_14_3_um_filter_31_253]PIZ10312.1 MAG: hypotheti